MRMKKPALVLAATMGWGFHAQAAGGSLEDARRQAEENRDSVIQPKTGERSRLSLEFGAMTERDWYGADQHARIGPGINLAYNLRRPANFRLLSLYAGVLFGQQGDQAHQWVHLQVGTTPTMEIPLTTMVGLYLGPRAIVELSQFDTGQSEGATVWDPAVGLGNAAGIRLLDGMLAVEVTQDFALSLDRGFRGDPEKNDWVPRLGLNIKTDLGAFIGGSPFKYPSPKPRDVDLALLVEDALITLGKRIVVPDNGMCAPVDAAVTLQVATRFAQCGGADVDGFFCRLAQGSMPLFRRDVELAWEVHQQLAVCYQENRRDQQAASRANELLSKKMRYGTYPPQLRRVMGCECVGCQSGPAAAMGAMEDNERVVAAEEERQKKLDMIRKDCPLAGYALDRLKQSTTDSAL